MFCSNCGNQVPDNAAFCSVCGNKLQAPQMPVAPVVPVAPIVPAAPVVAQTPAEPMAPAAPVIPVEPIAPVAPAEPIVSTEPTAPAVPVTPTAPVEPVIPVQPTYEAPQAPVYNQPSEQYGYAQPTPVVPFTPQPEPQKPNKKGGKLWIIIVIVVLVLALVGVGVFGYTEGWFNDLFGGSGLSQTSNNKDDDKDDNSSNTSSDNTQSGNQSGTGSENSSTGNNSTQSESQNSSQNTSSTTSQNSAAVESAIASFSSVDNDGYCDTFFVVYSGETITTITNIYGANYQDANEGEYFSNEIQTQWYNYWADSFENFNFNRAYVTTQIDCNDTEISITVKAKGLNNPEASQQFEQTGWIEGYTSDMTFSEFKQFLLNYGYTQD